MTAIHIYQPQYPRYPNGTLNKEPKIDKEYRIGSITCTGSMISYRFVNIIEPYQYVYVLCNFQTIIHFTILRTILTAAHCICHLPGYMDPSLPSNADFPFVTPCKKQDENDPQLTLAVNQHIPLKDSRGLPLKESYLALKVRFKAKVKSVFFNFLSVSVGSKDYRTGVKQPVESAFVMNQGAYWPYEKPDVGLVITEIEIKRYGRYPESHVSPICLPSRYETYANIVIWQFTTNPRVYCLDIYFIN